MNNKIKGAIFRTIYNVESRLVKVFTLDKDDCHDIVVNFNTFKLDFVLLTYVCNDRNFIKFIRYYPYGPYFFFNGKVDHKSI